MAESQAESGYVWSFRDRADHDAGHPSGYDCDGLALMPLSEACGHIYPPGQEKP